MATYLAVVLESLVAGGFGVGAGKRDVAYLEQLRGGEESHVRRVVEERVAEAALIDENGAEAGALGFDGASHARGSGADDEDVEMFRFPEFFRHLYRLDDAVGNKAQACQELPEVVEPGFDRWRP